MKKNRRKPRKGEFTCRCTAYKFPHRFGGGNCHGFHLISNQWFTFYGSGSCEDCNNKDENSCQVIEGIEKESECPVFQEFVELEEIKLLGKYWRKKKWPVNTQH